MRWLGLPQRCDTLKNFVSIIERVESYLLVFGAWVLVKLDLDAIVKDHHLFVFPQLLDMLNLDFLFRFDAEDVCTKTEIVLRHVEPTGQGGCLGEWTGEFKEDLLIVLKLEDIFHKLVFFLDHFLTVFVLLIN